MVGILQDAQPFLIPTGELTCDMCLPEVCNLPIGMRWLVDIGFPDFLSSVQATLGGMGTIFQNGLSALDPMISKWFELIASDTEEFAIPGCPMLPLYDDHFPAIDTGLWPDTVQDNEGFSPLMDMIN